MEQLEKMERELERLREAKEMLERRLQLFTGSADRQLADYVDQLKVRGRAARAVRATLTDRSCGIVETDYVPGVQYTTQGHDAHAMQSYILPRVLADPLRHAATQVPHVQREDDTE